MRYKFTFFAGFATGYVLGAKAGHQRYEQISQATRRLLGRPEVQRLAETARTEAADFIDIAKRAVTERVGGHDVTEQVGHSDVTEHVGAGVRV